MRLRSYIHKKRVLATPNLKARSSPSPWLAIVFFYIWFFIRYSIYASSKTESKKDKVPEYLEIFDKTDKAVEAVETDMLHNTFDQGPDNPLRFILSEVH